MVNPTVATSSQLTAQCLQLLMSLTSQRFAAFQESLLIPWLRPQGVILLVLLIGACSRDCNSAVGES